VAEALHSRGLVDRVGDGYRVDAALSASLKPKVSPEWTIKLILYYRKLAEKHHHSPLRLLPDLDAIRKMLDCLLQCGLWADVIAIARGIEGALALTGQWDAWGQVLDAILLGARKLEDRREEAWALHQQGVRALCLDNAHTSKVQLATALRMRTSLGDTFGAEATRQNLEVVTDAVARAPVPFEAESSRRRLLPTLKIALGLAAALLIAVVFWAFRGREEASPAPAAPLAIAKLSVVPEILGGESASVLVELNRAVSPPGAGSQTQAVLETIVGDPTLVRAPRTVPVPVGKSKVAVPIQTVPVAATQRVKLTVAHVGVGQEATLVLKPEISLQLTASEARGGQIVPAVLRSRAPAPAGGLQLTLEINHPKAAIGPASVVIPAGEREARFELQCLPVSTDQSVEVAARYEDLRPHASFDVKAGNPFVLVPPSVVGGERIRGLVILPQPAPPGGSEFHLKCGNLLLPTEHPLLRVPESVTVPEGRMVCEFYAATEPVAKSTSVAVHSTSGTLTETVHIMVRPAVDFVIQHDPTRGAGFYRGVVRLPVPSPVDTPIRLQQQDALDVPAMPVVLRKGDREVEFPIAVTASEPVEVTMQYDGIECHATTPAQPEMIAEGADRALPKVEENLKLQTVAREQTAETATAVLRIELPAPAPQGGAVVRLASSDPAVVVPATVEIPAGSRVEQFAAQTTAGGQAVQASITATCGGQSAETTLIFPLYFELELGARQIPGGGATTCRILTNRATASDDLRFEVVNHNPEVIQVPPTVVIPAGEQEATFPINTRAVSVEREADVTVRYGNDEKTVGLTLTVDFEISATFEERSGQAKGTVRLSAPAPATGAEIRLKSNAPRVAHVPPVAMVPAGETLATFPIAFSGPPQTVTIVGSYAGLSRAFVVAPPAAAAPPAGKQHVPEARRTASDPRVTQRG